MENLNLPTKENLRQVPKDEIVDATVINLEVKTWRDFISADKLEKFDNPDEKLIFVKYDYNGFIREEKFAYHETPTTTSRLGRYLVKYDKFEIGSQIKVQFDEEGKSNIVLAK